MSRSTAAAKVHPLPKRTPASANGAELDELRSKFTAIGRAMAVIEFNLDGTIVDANNNFLSAVGYTLPEVQTKHHSIFCDSTYAQSTEYKEFWAR